MEIYIAQKQFCCKSTDWLFYDVILFLQREIFDQAMITDIDSYFHHPIFISEFDTCADIKAYNLPKTILLVNLL